MVANHHVNRLAMFHVEHTHIFKMWKCTPHRMYMLLMGGSLWTPKRKRKKHPIPAELIGKIQSRDDRYEKPALLRINMTHLGYILDVLD